MNPGSVVRAWFRRRSPVTHVVAVVAPGVKHMLGRAPFLVPALGRLIEVML